MAEKITDERLAEIEAEHQPDQHAVVLGVADLSCGSVNCNTVEGYDVDSVLWPCHAAQLVAEIRRLRTTDG